MPVSKYGLSSQKEIREILDEQLEAGLYEYERSRTSLLVSSLTAGMEVGFSVFLMGILYTLYHGELSAAGLHTILAFAYPIGFLLVVIGRSELFTEHTNLALYPVLENKQGIPDLLILWGTILFGNILGGFFIGAMLTWVAPAMDIISPEAFIHLAEKMIKHDLLVIFGSALLAGWLMGLLSWMIAAAQETVSRMLIIMIITTVIGMGGLHHCIVGSVEIFCGLVLSPDIGWGDYLPVQAIAIAGNAIGGAFFVACFKWIHVKKAEA
jgi:formate/nitrite transporter FocA (FNT family)